MKQFYNVRGSQEQAIPLIVQKDTVYIHDNIHQVQVTDMDGAIRTEYEYNETQYDKDEYISNITSIQNSIKNIVGDTSVANPITLTDYQQNKIYELNTACNKDILAGFSSSVVGVLHQYKFDMEYQNNMNQEATILLLDTTITSVDWPTIDAGVVTHTRDQFIQLCRDSKIFKEQKIYRYFNLKQQVLNATTIDMVNTIVW